jgi:hypothetical protein
MTQRLHDYQRRKIDLALQRRRHAAEAAPGCQCPFCLAPGEVMAAIAKRVEAERERIGPPPF